MFRIVPIIGLIYLLIRLQWLIRRPWLLWVTRVALAVFFALGIWVLVSHRSGDVDVDSAAFQLAAWTGLGMFGYVGKVLLLLIPLDLLLLVAAVLSRLIRKKPLTDPSRRSFVRDTAGVALLGVPAIANVVGMFQGATGPRLKEVEVPVRGLPADLDGLRIAQISDLHVSPTILRPYVERVVALTMSAQPDIIALTGDLVDAAVERIPHHVEPMSRLSAPLGVYYVTGNHEYYSGEPGWSAHWVSQGFHHLTNAHRRVRRGASEIVVAGVPDKSAPQFGAPSPDPVAAMRGGEDAAFKLLLAHRPDACTGAGQAGFDLQLSGHTHAGQFHPWSLYVPLAHPYTRGLNRHTDKTWVYVNPGTGYWGPPSRFGIPSEVTLIRLKRA